MKRKTKLITWFIIGILFALGPMWGILATVLGMIGAFGRFSQAPEVQPELLAGHMSLVLQSTMIGCLAFPIGIVITVIAAMKLQKSKKVEGNQ